MLKTVLIEKSETDRGIYYDTNVLLNDVPNDISIRLYSEAWFVKKKKKIGSKPNPS